MRTSTDKPSEAAQNIYARVAYAKSSQTEIISMLADNYFNMADSYDDMLQACEYALWIRDFATVQRLSNMLKKIYPEYIAELDKKVS